MKANMDNDEFLRRFKGVNAPAYRGAPHPPFDEAAINESAFDDELRYKEFEIKIEDGVLRVKWTSQRWANPHGKFTDEVRRCLNAIGYKGEVFVDIASRDGFDDERDTYTFSVL